MIKKPTIVWFRQDLRLEDHPPLMAAIDKGGPVIPVFIWAPEEEKEWRPGGASRWWLHHSLASLQEELKQIGLTLILRQHSSLETLQHLVKQTGADAVFWNRRFEPQAIQQDARIKAELQKLGVKSQSFNGGLLFDPWTILNKQHKPYQIFTYFWKKCCQIGEIEAPLPKPKKVRAYPGELDSVYLDYFHLLPTFAWDKGLQETWRVGSYAAREVLKNALQQIIAQYTKGRNIPSIKGTTDFSPYLHYGEISPRMIWHAVRQQFGDHEEANAFLRQLGWREFAYYLLYHFPQTPTHSLNARFQAFPWQVNDYALKAWQKGLTGFPIVDAGMRQLWHTGWMHNRVRMIVASFLVKDLLIHWQEGAKWFWDTLVDADLANNTLGWQWIAGCGANAAPYFRVFNPVTQGEKFDPQGDYIRKWIPEISALPKKWIHQPWRASEQILEKSGIILDLHYPRPIIDHHQARKLALEAYSTI